MSEINVTYGSEFTGELQELLIAVIAITSVYINIYATYVYIYYNYE